VSVPAGFLTEVERARAAGRRGDLRLCAYESRRMPWAAAGLRAAVEAQLDLGAFSDAKETLAWLLEVQPADSVSVECLRRCNGSPIAALKGAPPGRVLLFTGHMVDAPGRSEPRFPPTAAAEAEARQMILEAIRREHQQEEHAVTGIAGGACGGDILFHETCEALRIPTQLLLALPPDQFIAASVQHGGSDWVERFMRLSERLPTRVLAETSELPSWIAAEDYTLWQRNNLWTLFNALSLDAPRLTLIALWDRGNADGPGGTADLVEQVRSRGYKVERLPAERLKALG
jgi:hypothetical protein